MDLSKKNGKAVDVGEYSTYKLQIILIYFLWAGVCIDNKTSNPSVSTPLDQNHHSQTPSSDSDSCAKNFRTSEFKLYSCTFFSRYFFMKKFLWWQGVFGLVQYNMGLVHPFALVFHSVVRSLNLCYAKTSNK